MSSAKLPMWIGLQRGSSYSHTKPLWKHGRSSVCESVMCGVMKSFSSAIIFEQQRFGHHSQKEKRHQTHQRRFERDVEDPRQRRVQHEHYQSQSCTKRPSYEELARWLTSSARTQQSVGYE